MTNTLQICSSNVYVQNANHSLSAAQIYCELSVGTALSACCHRLYCIDISLDSCLLPTDTIQLLLFITVDVRSQHFMQCSISVNINCIQLPTDTIQLLLFITVDVRSQHFMQYSISVNINCIEFPQCCSLF